MFLGGPSKIKDFNLRFVNSFSSGNNVISYSIILINFYQQIPFYINMSVSGQAIVNEFLSGLPSNNPDNFQKWGSDSQKQNITRRPLCYVPTKDIPAQQVIVTEKTNILLRHLHQKFKSNKPVLKRENASTPTDDDSQRKRQRVFERIFPRISPD